MLVPFSIKVKPQHKESGIGVNSKNKWLKLLENSLINDDTSQKNPMRYRTIATIVVISALLVFFLVPIQPSGFLPCPEGQSCATYYRSTAVNSLIMAILMIEATD